MVVLRRGLRELWSSGETEKEREMEPEKQLKEIQNFVEWHPSKNHLYSYAHEHDMSFVSEEEKHNMAFYHEKLANKFRMLFYPEEENDEVRCFGCREPIEYAMYGCAECQIFFHKACAELPREIIKHPSHESHRLMLVQQDLGRNPPPVGRPAEMSSYKRKCSGCDLPMRGSMYRCVDCDILLHKFCLELPPQIHHPNHPSHRLLLNHESVDVSNNFNCTACSKSHTGLNYQCEGCDYNLGIPCIFKTGAAAAAAAAARSDGIMTQGHLLTFMREQPSYCQDDDCLACGESISQPIFRCKQCQFSLHVQCVLSFTVSVLPRTFRSKFHNHPLTLTNFFTEDDINWQICDVCDEEIYPTSSFYYCAKCDFADDLTCALREMGMSFAHKLDNVVLDASPFVIENPSLTVTQIVESITEDDKKKFGEIVESITEDDQRRKLLNPAVEAATILIEKDGAESKREDPQLGQIVVESIPEDDDDEIRELNDAVTAATTENEGAGRKLQMEQQDDSGSSTHKEPFAQIMDIFASKRQDPKFGLTYYETRSQVVNLSDTEHKISKNLAPVLDVLISKYGDFYADSPVSPEGKTFIFTILCAAIYSICNTKDAEINEFQLFTCWDCFKIAQHAGFKVDFAINRLRRAMLSYFGLGSTGPALAELDNDDAAIKLRKDIKALDEKCELLDNEMAKLGQKMKALQEKRELRMTTLLSYSMGKISSDTVEIVEQNEVLSSWDDESWDVREKCLVGEKSSNTSEEEDCQGETSEVLERQSKLLSTPTGQEGQNGTLKLVRYSKAMSRSDWQKILTNKIKAFIDKKGDEVFWVHDKVSGSRCEQDTTHDCTSLDELQKKINNRDFHKHALTLFRGFKDVQNKTNKKAKDDALCIACKLPVSDAKDKSYHCSKCEIVFHTFCVNVPKEIIKHPLHPQHPLLLDTDSERLRKITCNACGEKFCGYGYSCRECNFSLEVQCLFLELEPTIQSRSHGNLLLLEEKRPPLSPHRCFACGKKIPGPPFLRCATCNISLHVQCPLPSAIATTLHEHNLALTPWYFGDADEPHCNFCQKQMNPVHPTYSCEVCEYYAHADCATLNATFNVN